MRIQFCGAVRSVTGSMHILEAGERRILLECGLYQGHRKEARERNKTLPFDPTRITHTTLSHAHIDHSGNLPNLVKNGYRGRITATEATADLARVLLRDSAYIQEKDAEYLNRKVTPGHDLVEPLYTQVDADEAAARIDTVRYQERVELAPGVHMTCYDAGHILGSAVTLYEVEEGGRTVRIGFTGDLGRPNHPILRDPQYLPHVDYLITESTYGNRLHEAAESMKDKLRQVVQETIDGGGRLLIPAFSVGRTQNLLYYLAELFHAGELPRVPIFVDSPLAIDATKAYRDHPECYDAETKAMLEHSGSVFGFDLVTYTRSPEESKELNTFDSPCVVISASGMCEGGRVLHHLKRSVERPEDTILIVGYQAEHTLGRRLVERAPTVKIYGQSYKVSARIKKMNGFSAHADRDELASYIKVLHGLKGVFVVHGEEAASLSLASYLTDLGIKTHVPQPLELVEL
ncbi:MAG: MBL fold metallo-hydrolase RNA specificity domain-containing protein [Planctomycetota bacterium]